MMKSVLSIHMILVLVAFRGQVVHSVPVTGPDGTGLSLRSWEEVDETGLSLRSSGEVIEYSELQARRELSAQVFSSTTSLLSVLTGGVCAAAFASAGVALPAQILCPIFAVASLGYAFWGHYQQMVSPRDLATVTSTPNSYYHYNHLYPDSDEWGRPIDQLQAAYNGTERVLAIHHPCSTHGCYNVWYHNYLDSEGIVVHHLALEPRGDWHLEKRQLTNGGIMVHTDKGTPFYADYDFYDVHKGVEKDFGKEGHNAFKKDLLAAEYNNKHDLHHAGYFCMNWSEKGHPAGTKGVYWQSENYHMADPDALPSRLQRCKKYTDPHAK